MGGRLQVSRLSLTILLAVSAGAAQPVGSQPDSSNAILSFRVMDISNAQIRVTVDYRYNGSRGMERISLVACMLLPDGSQVPGTACEHIPVAARSGTVTFEVVRDEPEPLGESVTSSEVEVCMYQAHATIIDGSRGERFHCQRFPHSKTWQSTAVAPVDSSQAARIVRFTATPSAVRRGETVTLQWQTSNVGIAWILPNGGAQAADWRESGLVQGTDNTVSPSGQMRIKPGKSTPFTLLARTRRTGTDEVRRTIRVEVDRGTCSVSGTITGNLRPTVESQTFRLTHTGLFDETTRELLQRAPVVANQQYRFAEVFNGTYLLAPVGGGWVYQPRGRVVTCQSNSHIEVNFRVTGISTEG